MHSRCCTLGGRESRDREGKARCGELRAYPLNYVLPLKSCRWKKKEDLCFLWREEIEILKRDGGGRSIEEYSRE